MVRIAKLLVVASCFLGTTVKAAGPLLGRDAEGVVLPNGDTNMASYPYPPARILRSEAAAAAAAAAAASRMEAEAAPSSSLLSFQEGPEPMRVVGEQEIYPQQQQFALQQQLEQQQHRQYYSERQQPLQQAGYLPMPLDELNADAYCGGPELISSCGFHSLPEICVPLASGGSKCIRGVCVCYGQAGCMEPVCRVSSCNASSTFCSDGVSCITMPGTNWRCLHPCNTEHPVQDYGAHQTTVNYIRTSTQYCSSYGGAYQSGAYPNAYGTPEPVQTEWVDDLSAGMNLSSMGAFAMSQTPGQEIISTASTTTTAPSRGWFR